MDTLPSKLEDFTNKIWHCDALGLLKALPDKSIKLIVTSPPYNLRNRVSGGLKKGGKWMQELIENGYDNYSDNLPRSEYIDWQRAILSESMRVLKDNGAIFYNHKPRVQNGLIESPQEIIEGFPLRQIIIWDRGSGMNFNEAYFTPSYEFIYMITGEKFKLKRTSGRDVWLINFQDENPHPAPFPKEIPLRILQSVEMENEIVLDMFGGSGTTALAAQMLEIDYITCDKSKKYVDMATERLNKANPELSKVYPNGKKQMSLFSTKED